MRVAIDPRIELVSVIQYLAGSSEYQFAPDTPYRRAVQEQFEPFRSHPAVVASEVLHREHGIGHDAPIALAVYLDRVRLAPIQAVESTPLDERWRGIDVATYLAQLREFAIASSFSQFLRTQVEYTTAVEERLSTAVGDEQRTWFQAFLGAGRADFTIVPKLLPRAWSYEVHAHRPSGHEDVFIIVELEDVDANGIPRPTYKTVSWAAHEMAHEYVNPVVEAHFATLEGSASKLFALTRSVMEQQAYATPTALIEETLVRALVVLYLHTKVGEDIAQQAMLDEQKRGFVWLPDVVKLLVPVATEVGRTQVPASLVELIPPLAAFFTTAATLLEQQIAAKPH